MASLKQCGTCKKLQSKCNFVVLLLLEHRNVAVKKFNFLTE